MQRHPLNRGFAWQPIDRPLRRLTPAQATAYDRDGFTVLPDALPAETVEALVAEIDPLERRAARELRARPGGRRGIARADEITFVPHLVTRSPGLRAFCASPLFRDLTHDLIGPDVRLYWDQAVYKKPRTASEFPWHQDNGYTYVEPQAYLTFWIPLVDVDERNGCPWVVPGLHRHGTLAHRATPLGFQCLSDPSGAQPVSARAGSLIAFSSLTPHRTGPNRTDTVRRAYIVQFAPDGAERVEGGPGATRREPCTAPERQFPILVNGGGPLESAGASLESGRASLESAGASLESAGASLESGRAPLSPA